MGLKHGVVLLLAAFAQEPPDPSLVKVADPPDLSKYEELVGPEVMRELRELAARVQGKTFRHVNATPEGGGVAEILHRVVPFLNALGVDARWSVLEGTPEFFEVTKKFHNGIQGAPLTLSDQERRTYDDVLARNASRIPLTDDVYLIHDPQPAGLIRYIRPGANIAWRVHIDTSNANPEIWGFVASRAAGAQVALYHMPEFVKESGAAPVVMQPSIDPLSAKNRAMSEAEVESVLRKYGIETDKPLVTQVSRFDKWKDPLGVMDAFVRLRQGGTDARLVYVGSGSVDDPEGLRVYEEVQERFEQIRRAQPEIARDMKIMMTPYDPLLVNAIQRKSAVILQLSTKEGFGLTATEAMWKGTPVVARPSGGLKAQVIDGETGFLVNTPEEAAERIRYLLENPRERAQMGAAARRHVKENFLITRNVRDYLLLMQPEFYETARNGTTPRPMGEIHASLKPVIVARDLVKPYEALMNEVLQRKGEVIQANEPLAQRYIDLHWWPKGKGQVTVDDGMMARTRSALDTFRAARWVDPQADAVLSEALTLMSQDRAARKTADIIRKGELHVLRVPAEKMGGALGQWLRGSRLILVRERLRGTDLAEALVHEGHHARDPRSDGLHEARAYRAQLDFAERIGRIPPEQKPTLEKIRRMSDPELQRHLEGMMPDLYRPNATNRSRAIVRGIGGMGAFGAAYLLKEGLNALETRDRHRMGKAALQLKQPRFWLDVGTFTAAAGGVTWGLDKLPGTGTVKGLSKAAVPLTAGMLAVQALSGRLSWSDAATGTAAFLTTGTLVHLALRAGPAGWLRIPYSVIKMALTLYGGEKLDALLRGLLPRRRAMDRDGVQDMIQRLAER
ncbi:MAG: glycosyltransferase [Planctomycetes bacterium]|nr:glycosyltransferase [Planctomycetota bacterium]